MRGRILCLLLALMPVAAAADESPVGMSYVETKDLRLIYYDSLGYLVPHAVRTFLNSLAFQRRLFTFEPSGRVTVLLTDFSDTGNAGATSVTVTNSVVANKKLSPLGRNGEIRRNQDFAKDTVIP